MTAPAPGSRDLPSFFRAFRVFRGGPLALSVVLIAAAFYRGSNSPIHHLDTWSHWKYGEWIWQHGRIPEREPFSPYSDKSQRFVDTLWLSQVVGYLVYDRLGVEGVALFYGILEALKTILYLEAFRRLAGSGRRAAWLALAATVLVWVGLWRYFGVLRPQTIAEVCWAALLVACARRPFSRASLFWLPPVFALWANLHGGFLVGFVFLGIVVVGRYLDTAREARGLARAANDPDFQRAVLVVLFCAAAACVNPLGPRLFAEVARFGNHPSLRGVAEWQPMLPLLGYNSKAMTAAVILSLVTLRLSPRPFSPADAGLLLVFGLAAWFAARMFPWWMTVCPFVLVPHWRAILDKERGRQGDKETEARPRSSLLVSLSPPLLVCVSGGVAAVLFLLSGTGQWLLGQGPRSRELGLSPRTPVAATDRFKEWLARPDAPTCRVYCPSEWSDYLLWELPPKATVYRYSHWQYFPPQSNDRYFALLDLRPPPGGWRSVLERTRLNVVFVRAGDGPAALYDYLRGEKARGADSEWEILYDDQPPGEDSPAPDSTLVAVRRTDPFAQSLAGAAAAQACVGGGLTPTAADWAFLSQMPWAWPER